MTALDKRMTADEIVSRLHDIHRTIYAKPPSQNMCNSVTLPPILDV